MTGRCFRRCAFIEQQQQPQSALSDVPYRTDPWEGGTLAEDASQGDAYRQGSISTQPGNAGIAADPRRWRGTVALGGDLPAWVF